MKSTNPRKKLLSDYSSQDELSLKRPINAEKDRRSRKPSIYDEMDDEEEDDFVNQLDDDINSYDDEEDEDNY